MNQSDRKQVADILARLEALQSQVTSIGEELQSLADAEQEKYDNLSEGLQASEKGEAISCSNRTVRGTPMTTKHTCAGPVFGRLTAGCARCDELAKGAAPVQWSQARRLSEDRQRCAEIRAHFDGEYHRTGKCGPVCTFGEW